MPGNIILLLDSVRACNFIGRALPRDAFGSSQEWFSTEMDAHKASGSANASESTASDGMVAPWKRIVDSL
jgi:hypothetical protein